GRASSDRRNCVYNGSPRQCWCPYLDGHRSDSGLVQVWICLGLRRSSSGCVACYRKSTSEFAHPAQPHRHLCSGAESLCCCCRETCYLARGSLSQDRPPCALR